MKILQIGEGDFELERAGHEVAFCKDRAAAEEYLLSKKNVDLVLFALSMDSMSFLRWILVNKITAPTIVASGVGKASEAIYAGAEDFVANPADLEEVRARLFLHEARTKQKKGREKLFDYTSPLPTLKPPLAVVSLGGHALSLLFERAAHGEKEPLHTDQMFKIISDIDNTILRNSFMSMLNKARKTAVLRGGRPIIERPTRGLYRINPEVLEPAYIDEIEEIITTLQNKTGVHKSTPTPPTP